MSEKLLIVEDDKKLNDGIRLALKNDAYFFYQCRTLQEAREILKKEGLIVIRYYLALRGAENGVTAMVTPFFCVQG